MFWPSVIIAMLFVWLAYITGSLFGYKDGYDRGVICTLDTVNHIVSKQMKSDSTVTKLVLELDGAKKDTVGYYLSKKTIKATK